MRYGFRCPCHGVQIFETQDQRDAFAITYQCRLEMFRIEPAADLVRPGAGAGGGSMSATVNWQQPECGEDEDPVDFLTRAAEYHCQWRQVQGSSHILGRERD